MEKLDAWKMTDDLHVALGKAEPFSAAFRATRMAMVVTDPQQDDNPIIFANDAFLRLTGYDRDEVTGRNCRFLQGKDTDRSASLKIREAIAAGQDIAIDLLNYRKDGTPFWNALYLSPVSDIEGRVKYFFASQVDATERKVYEMGMIKLQKEQEQLIAEREAALQRSQLLLHEVDHRVKNNLQMISAMLTLQSMSIPDLGIKSTLQEMLERVDAMGLVHKRLYQSDSITDFDIAEFTREIANNLVASTGRTDIGLAVKTESVMIKADHAASVALVVNETITNALKHAFPIGTPGDLRVHVTLNSKSCEISVIDDGPGMPRVSTQKTSFGKMLIETLVKQLRATIEWLPAYPGTHVRITLPL
jgi:PAS domain S-box-containing protein